VIHQTLKLVHYISYLHPWYQNERGAVRDVGASF
jgi:hypothetical protein